MNQYIDELIDYGLRKGLIDPLDIVYIRNRLLDVLGQNEYTQSEQLTHYDDIETLLNLILQDLVDSNKLEDTMNSKDMMDTRIMDCLTPLPSKVIHDFQSNYQTDPKLASDEYYKFAKNTNYIRTQRIQKDKKWTVNTEYGELDVTINLSKPEKDPKDIEKAKLLPANNYPKCLLCKENEGFAGTLKHPARNNHRIIPLSLDDRSYYLQYSPYSYYNEHCIVFNDEHIPMVINHHTFSALLDFVKYLPHYFVGSNADLPIVGGSILSHDHFQGGHYEFLMEKAQMLEQIQSDEYEGITYGRVKWPLSTIRIKGKHKQAIVDFACHVLDKWIDYSDEKLSIMSHTDKTRHNTITPIARMKNGVYELDLVLRNNRCNDEYPQGIFHPHQELHHIKKENIGLIEVMGLAVLPSRLLSEMELIKQAWLHQSELDESLQSHKVWFEAIKNKYVNVDEDCIEGILQEEIGLVFLEVLNHAGVFKQDEEGQLGFMKFMSQLVR